MDVIPEVLTSLLVPKIDSINKNGKKKKDPYQQQHSTNKEEVTDDVDNKNKAKLVEKRSNWGEKDRRSTNDRRKQVAKRGRWLESRNKKDRRQSAQAISITI